MNILKLLFDQPIMLVLTLIGLVEAIKVLFIERKKFQPSELQIFAVAMVIGLVLGVVVQVYDSGVPTGFNAWVDLVLYGLFFGILAPWIYKAAGNILQKAAAKLIIMTDGALDREVVITDSATEQDSAGIHTKIPEA